jgi:hypothetical protein
MTTLRDAVEALVLDGTLDDLKPPAVRRIFALIDAHEAECGLDVERLATALREYGFVRGVAARYGTFKDAYWQDCAEGIAAALREPRP